MIIICDSREQKNSHILKRFDELGIRRIRRKLEFGDYSFMFDGMSYENRIVVERKNSITEICGNLGKGKSRFQKEFEKARVQGCKLFLMIEDDRENIDAGKYRSRFNPGEVKSRLNTWCHSFMIQLDFIEKTQAADHILKTFNEFIQQKSKIKI